MKQPKQVSCRQIKFNTPAEIKNNVQLSTHGLSWSEDEAVLSTSIPGLYSKETYC